jgi:hypothetical protein
MNKLPILDSKITLMQVLQHTYNSKFKNRDLYMKRDVLVTVKIIEKKVFDKVEKKIKATYYQIKAISFSYPNYGKYITGKSGNKQRKYKHEYTHTLELIELKLSSIFRYRLGSEKKWNDSPPKNMVQSVSLRERDLIKTRLASQYKVKSKAQEEYSKILKQRKAQGKFLDVGDYNSRVNGINGDFYFRLQNVLSKFGALYGRKYPVVSEEVIQFPFLPKHLIRVLNYLFQKNIIKWN